MEQLFTVNTIVMGFFIFSKLKFIWNENMDAFLHKEIVLKPLKLNFLP